MLLAILVEHRLAILQKCPHPFLLIGRPADRETKGHFLSGNRHYVK